MLITLSDVNMIPTLLLWWVCCVSPDNLKVRFLCLNHELNQLNELKNLFIHPSSQMMMIIKHIKAIIRIKWIHAYKSFTTMALSK